MITKFEFDQLTFEEKGYILEHHGHYVSSINTSNGTTSLFFVEGLFIETLFNPKENLICEIERVANNAPILNRYLARFNVSDFY